MIRWFVCMAAVLLPATAGARTAQPLRGTLVIIDPGHGGLDDGASGRVRGQRVVEDEHVYDIALRLRDRVRALGGRAELTVMDAKQTRPTANRAGRYLADDRNESVVGKGCAPLTAGTRCLNARIAAGRSFVRKHWHRRVVWISIHFDVGRPATEGAVVLVPATGAPRSARAVARAFGRHPDRTRAWNGKPADDILRSGDRSHGIRRLYILSRKNPFSERMLVELGNFRNPRDLWRIRDPRVRQEFAVRLASGITAWAQEPVVPQKRSTRLVRR